MESQLVGARILAANWVAGLVLVRAAGRPALVPWFAIGGIDTSTLDEVLAAGATRVAVVRAVGAASDPEAAARDLKARLTRSSGS